MNDFFVGVPYTGCENNIGDTPLIATREDEAVGIAVGAWFTGKKPLVFMQDSGLCNCLDIITSLLKPYDIKIDLLINNRTHPEHHALMGALCVPLLKELKYESFRMC